MTPDRLLWFAAMKLPGGGRVGWGRDWGLDRLRVVGDGPGLNKSCNANAAESGRRRCASRVALRHVLNMSAMLSPFVPLGMQA